MPPYNRSSMNVTTAKAVVADSAGASGDAEMLVRAGRALDATAQRWNRVRWRFLLTSASNIPVTPPFAVTGCSGTVGTASITTSSNFTTAGVTIDDLIVGGGLDNETQVLTTGATALTTNASALSSFSNTSLTFVRPLYALPADFKSVFTVRLLANPRPLFYVARRDYDHLVSTQNTTTIPYLYDLFTSESGGKIRLIPPPIANDVIKLRYFRRITMPTAIATASGLDIPQDTEDVFLAHAKAFFLADKEGPQNDRCQYWQAYAAQGLKEILNDTNVIPDENLTMKPHEVSGFIGYGNPNSTLFADWE